MEASIPTEFTLYDVMLFTGKPDLSGFGLPPVYITGNEMWSGNYPNYDMTRPNEAAVRALARKVAALNRPLVIDIEHWEISIMRVSVAEAEYNLRMLVQIIDWVKDERPNLKVGYYGMLPLSDYWMTSNYGHALLYAGTGNAWWDAMLPKATATYIEMQAANDFVANALASKVDFLCPSFYTFYEDQQGWRLVSTLRMAEARRFGPPVLPFLWMQYHEGGPVREHTLYLPVDYWRMQLETVLAHADGAMIWGGWLTPWDDSAQWWLETIRFIEALRVPPGHEYEIIAIGSNPLMTLVGAADMNYLIGSIRYGQFYTMHPQTLEPTDAQNLAITIYKDNVPFIPNGGINIIHESTGKYSYNYMVKGGGIGPGDTIIEEIRGKVIGKTTRVNIAYSITSKLCTVGAVETDWFGDTGIMIPARPVNPGWFGSSTRPHPPRKIGKRWL